MPTDPTARVTSADGTEIAVWASGEGSPLVLVHGATADHHRWSPLLPYLEPSFTVWAIDRRGRGQSGDAPAYDPAREFEDVAAVIDAAARASGSRVDVYGHSYGGLCVFGAATLTTDIGRLVLYEGWPAVDLEAATTPDGIVGRIESLVADGQPDAALEVLMREVLLLPPDEMEAVRAQPSWPARVAAVHTVPRELRAMSSVALDLEAAARIDAPALLLTGSDSPDPAAAEVDVVASAMGDARVEVLDGQQHIADVLAPEDFADRMVAFLRGS